MLIDAAVSRFSYGIVGNGQVPNDAVMNLVGVTERSATMYGRANLRIGRRSPSRSTTTCRGTGGRPLSYVTGSHSAKIGYQGAYFMYDRHTFVNETQMRYIFNNGVPTSVNYFVCAVSRLQRSHRDARPLRAGSVDARTDDAAGRAALRPRQSWAPGDKQGTTETSRFNPQPLPSTDTVRACAGYNDINPRVGFAYDIFGNGKTALKINGGRYLAAATTDGVYSANNPALKLVTQISGAGGRAWTDTNGELRWSTATSWRRARKARRRRARPTSVARSTATTSISACSIPT